MNIKIKKNGYLILDKLKFKCVFGKSGIKTRKLEGDKATPRGIYSLGKLYYRKDRLGKITTFLKKKIIKKNTGWCHNVKNKKYNREIKFTNYKDGEKLFKRDHNYDLLLVINYNLFPIISGKGSAIFLHLTSNYKKTNGCIAIQKGDFLKLLKYVNQRTKIFIN